MWFADNAVILNFPGFKTRLFFRSITGLSKYDNISITSYFITCTSFRNGLSGHDGGHDDGATPDIACIRVPDVGGYDRTTRVGDSRHLGTNGGSGRAGI